MRNWHPTIFHSIMEYFLNERNFSKPAARLALEKLNDNPKDLLKQFLIIEARPDLIEPLTNFMEVYKNEKF